MKPNNINKFFREIIEKSSKYYQEKAPRSKNEIWAEIIEDKKPNSQVIVKLLMAASIAVLLVFAFIQFYSNTQKDKLISELNNKIENLQNQNTNNMIALENNKLQLTTKNNVDTVVIEKINKVKEIITVVEYIRDTVYISSNSNIQQKDQLTRVQDFEILKTEQIIPESKDGIYKVEFILPDNKATGKEKNRLEAFIRDIAKNKPLGQTSSKQTSLQSSIKQFLFINEN